MRRVIAPLAILAACSAPPLRLDPPTLEAISAIVGRECEEQGLSDLVVAIALRESREVAVARIASRGSPTHSGSRWSYGLPPREVGVGATTESIEDMARRAARGVDWDDVQSRGRTLGSSFQIHELSMGGGTVAVATNRFPAPAPLTRVFRCVDALLRGAAVPFGPLAQERVSPTTLVRMIGRYAGGDASLEVLEIDGEPWIVPPTGPWLRVRAEAATGELRVRDLLNVDARIEATGDALELDGVTYLRIPGRPPTCAAELRTALGEYARADATGDRLLLLERHGRLRAITSDLVERDVTGDPSVLTAGLERLPTTSGTFRITPRHPPDELRRLAEAATPPSPPPDALPFDLVELRELDPTIRYDIRYATSDNFMGFALYTEASAKLQRSAAESVVRAHRALAAQGYGIVVHDAWRPWLVTKMFWDATPEHQHTFVADPSKGSRHNRGCAIDVSLFELASGAIVEMPSGYDEFTERAYPYWPGGTGRSRALRDLLRRTMEHEGFTVYEAEWWHFDFAGWRRYPVR